MRSAVVVLLVVLTVGPAQGQRPRPKKREPVVNGRTINQWADLLQKGKDADQFAAVAALMRAGPEAKPAVAGLIKLLAGKGLVRSLAQIVLSRVGPDAVPELRKALESKDAPTRAGAARALGLIGEEARPAAGTLAGLLADDDVSVRRAAATALGQIGSGARLAAPKLKKALGDKDAGVAVEAAWALWHLASDASGAEALAAACSSRDEAQALRAIQALGEMGNKASGAAKALRGALKHKNAEARLGAAVSLLQATGATDEALAAILPDLKGDEDTARRAVSALGQVPGEKATTQLLRQLGEGKLAVRREAAAALAGRPGDIKATGKALAAGLNAPDAGVRWWCAVGLLAGRERVNEELTLHALRPSKAEMEQALNLIGRERAGAALAGALKSAPTRFKADLARGVGEAGADARQAAGALLALLSSDDKHVRRAAADALPNLGLDLVPNIRRVLNGDSEGAREAAARALGGYGLPARSAVPTLIGRLRAGDAPLRTQCALAVWRIDGQADVALPVLDGVIKDVDATDRWEAVEAVGFIAVGAVPPIRGLTEVLVKALKDRDPRVRVTAAKWLWKRVKRGKAVLPLLRDVAGNRDTFTRQTVVETVGEIADEPASAPLMLATALEDRDLLVRVAAEQGLARIGSVEFVVKLLSMEKRRTPPAAVRVLGLMGPKAKAALPALGRLAIKDAAARAALARIFPDRPKQLAAYLAALEAGKETKELEKALR